MSQSGKISQRQIQIVQSATKILMEVFFISKEEALEIISTSLKEELDKSETTFELLEISSISYRQAFVRKLVHRVETNIRKNKNLRIDRINLAIEKFVQMIHSKWMGLDEEQ
jgi:hypothetical protein